MLLSFREMVAELGSGKLSWPLSLVSPAANGLSEGGEVGKKKMRLGDSLPLIRIGEPFR